MPKTTTAQLAALAAAAKNTRRARAGDDTRCRPYGLRPATLRVLEARGLITPDFLATDAGLALLGE